MACRVRTASALAEAGLHPATGGDGTQLCSGDMLLEALVACAGVTLRAVATSLGLEVTGTVHAEGDLDFRGTLGVDKEAPVGFRDIRLTFDLDTDADADQVATLIKLTERYCVVLQTHPPVADDVGARGHPVNGAHALLRTLVGSGRGRVLRQPGHVRDALRRRAGRRARDAAGAHPVRGRRDRRRRRVRADGGPARRPCCCTWARAWATASPTCTTPAGRAPGW